MVREGLSSEKWDDHVGAHRAAKRGEPSSAQGRGQGCGSTSSHGTYPQKPLQEFPGAVDVDAGDVAVAPQHAVHCGGHILPVLLCLGVKLKLILHHLARHAGCGARTLVGLTAPQGGGRNHRSDTKPPPAGRAPSEPPRGTAPPPSPYQCHGHEDQLCEHPDLGLTTLYHPLLTLLQTLPSSWGAE